MRWEITRIAPTDVHYPMKLPEGYEPFAVTPQYGTHYIWLRRKVDDEISHKQSNPKQRTSRRTTKKS